MHSEIVELQTTMENKEEEFKLKLEELQNTIEALEKKLKESSENG